jgi:type II secretion system protein G
MHSFQPHIPDRFGRRGGFTLIELLVVIAIIAILAAIIFPVFSAVRENAREATTMSSMHNIQAALALYKLDNRRYPDVLFAYACNGANDPVTGTPCNVNDSMTTVAQDPNNHDLLVGLYPEYDKNWQDFTCPNNLITNPAAVTPGVVADNIVCPKSDSKGNLLPVCGGITAGQMVVAGHRYFEADAMDISPEVINQNQFNGGNNTPANYTFLPRYQLNWESYANSPPGDPDNANNGQDPDYIRQLRWQNPPGNTYVTSVTYHVPNADKLLVLYEGGFVKKAQMPAGWFPPNFTNNNPGGWEQGFIDGPNTGIGVANAGNNSPAEFWRYDGTH